VSRLGRRGIIGFGLTLVAAGWTAQARAATVEITVAAGPDCAPPLRAVMAEQLADLATSVTFSCVGRADEEEPFRATLATAGGVRLWLDASLPAEARLTVRGSGDRFFVRRVPLAAGLDEVGREEIGQIVRSAVQAVLAGQRETLSRAEARVAVASWPARATPVQPPRPPPSETASFDRPSASPSSRRGADRDKPTGRHGLDLGAAATLRAFSSAIPIVGEVAVVAAVSGPSGGSLWLEGAYRFPARDLTPPIGLAIRALAFRGGLAVSSRAHGGRIAFRAGVGAGVERTSFSPQPAGGAVELAPGESFLVVTGRALAGTELRAAAHLRVGLIAFCDVQTKDVHYDFRTTDGTAHRVLTPFRLQPGITLSVSGELEL